MLRKSFTLKSLLLLILCMLFTIHCKDDICPACDTNISPIANAGPDQVIHLPSSSFELDGSKSIDPDGTIISYQWTKIVSPPAVISFNASSVKTIVKNDLNFYKGVFQFELKVTDNDFKSSADTVNIIFQDSQPNRPPSAHAGADLFVGVQITNVILDGSLSSDPDNNIISYYWSKINGPNSFKIEKNNGIWTQISELVAGEYEFELSVTDVAGLTGKDSVKIVVSETTATSLACDMSITKWQRLLSVPENDFIFGNYQIDWFDGDNFLMSVGSEIFAVSKKGSLWKYHLQTNTWQNQNKPFPEKLSNAPVTIEIKGSAYCISPAKTWEYNTTSNAWIEKKNPTGDLNHPIVVSDKAYLRDVLTNRMIEFDPVADTYTTRKACPLSLPLFAWFTIKENGYYIFTNGNCWKYDPKNDSWSQKANLPIINDLTFPLGFSLHSSGYVLADYKTQSYGRSLPLVLIRYDEAKNSWTSCSADYFTGISVYNMSAVSIADEVYIGLGYHNGDFSSGDFWKLK